MGHKDKTFDYLYKNIVYMGEYNLIVLLLLIYFKVFYVEKSNS